MTIRRTTAREGYSLWAETYDAQPNATVVLDGRITPQFIDVRPGERVLDAGCGTGRYFPLLRVAGGAVVGFDFAPGMLRVARRRFPDVPVVCGDLQRPWPFRDAAFDAILCALVGEHLADLPAVCGEMHRLLVAGGRIIFSVYHPAMAEAGVEANFRRDGAEYRLGALLHTIADYEAAFRRAGFAAPVVREFAKDAALAAQFPQSQRPVGFPMLAVLTARKEGVGS